MAKKATIRGHKPKVEIPVEPEVNDSGMAPLDPVIVEDEPVRGDTPDSTPLESAPAAPASTITPEPFARDQASHVVEFTTDAQGRYVAMTKDYRELFVRIGGARFEHVDEDDQGRWVYAKS